MVAIPLIELIQVVFAFFGGLFSGGELYDVNREVKADVKHGLSDPVYTFGIHVFRKRERALFTVHVLFFLTGLLVIHWRMANYQMLALLPSYTRNGSIMIAEAILSWLSLQGRLDRKRLIEIIAARHRRKGDVL